MRPNCVFSPAAMGSFSAALDSSIRDASFPRNANTCRACSPHPHTHPTPPPSPPPAAARASSNSRWTRLSMMETARFSSPPPLHFQLRKNSYSRKRAIGQPACPHVAAVLGTNRGRRLSNSRFAAPLACYLAFTRCLMLPLSRRIFSSFFSAGPLPLLAARSLVGAHSACSPSDSFRSDLWARTASRRRATHCVDGRAEQIR